MTHDENRAKVPAPSTDPLAAEWVTERVEEFGPASEIVRRIFAEELRSYLETFLMTAPTVEIMTMWAAFQYQETEGHGDPKSPWFCSFLEALMAVLGFDPKQLLDANLQRRPTRHAG